MEPFEPGQDTPQAQSDDFEIIVGAKIIITKSNPTGVPARMIDLGCCVGHDFPLPTSEQEAELNGVGSIDRHVLGRVSLHSDHWSKLAIITLYLDDVRSF